MALRHAGGGRRRRCSSAAACGADRFATGRAVVRRERSRASRPAWSPHSDPRALRCRRFHIVRRALSLSQRSRRDECAIYARVSSEVQEQRGTIGSQVEVLRARMAAEGHEIVPSSSTMVTPARVLTAPAWTRYAMPLRRRHRGGLVLDTRSPRALVRVSDARARRTRPARLPGAVHRRARDRRRSPGAAADPDAGVIAEYERRRSPSATGVGSCSGARCEAIFWKVPYGYRRVPRTAEGPARLEIHEPERYRGGTDEHRHATAPPPPLRARRPDADRTCGVVQLNARRDAAQPQLHGTAEWFRHETVAPPAPASRTAARRAGPRRTGTRPGPSDHHRRSVRGRATCQD